MTTYRTLDNEQPTATGKLCTIRFPKIEKKTFLKTFKNSCQGFAAAALALYHFYGADVNRTVQKRFVGQRYYDTIHTIQYATVQNSLHDIGLSPNKLKCEFKVRLVIDSASGCSGWRYS